MAGLVLGPTGLTDGLPGLGEALSTAKLGLGWGLTGLDDGLADCGLGVGLGLGLGLKLGESLGANKLTSKLLGQHPRETELSWRLAVVGHIARLSGLVLLCVHKQARSYTPSPRLGDNTHNTIG